jgi:hypothetical protein
VVFWLIPRFRSWSSLSNRDNSCWEIKPMFKTQD